MNMSFNDKFCYGEFAIKSWQNNFIEQQYLRAQNCLAVQITTHIYNAFNLIVTISILAFLGMKMFID